MTGSELVSTGVFGQAGTPAATVSDGTAVGAADSDDDDSDLGDFLEDSLFLEDRCVGQLRFTKIMPPCRGV